MMLRYLTLLLFLTVGSFALAQDADIGASLDYKIGKMKRELGLTEAQAQAITPIVKNYLSKKAAILEEVQGEGIVDHTAVKVTLNNLKEDEYKKLSKILTADQMQAYINKENIRASLNPDGGETEVDDGPSLTPEGANFKF